MIRPLVISIFLLGSFFATAQNDTKDISIKDTTNVFDIIQNPIDLKSNIVYYSSYAVRLNYKKSRELISIKAFRKTTHIRAKKSNRC